MSENEIETIEVDDVKPQEDARQEVIRQMMDQWADGKLTDAQDTFNSIMNVRADELVSGRKAEISASIYNDPIGEYESDEEIGDIEPEEVPEPEEASELEQEEQPEEPAEAEEHEEV